MKRYYILLTVIMLFGAVMLFTACGNDKAPVVEAPVVEQIAESTPEIVVEPEPVEKNLVVIPDLIGMSVIDAKNIMNDLSLVLVNYDDNPDFIIEEVNPSFGTKVEQGSNVYIAYANPEPDPEPILDLEEIIIGSSVTEEMFLEYLDGFIEAVGEMFRQYEAPNISRHYEELQNKGVSWLLPLLIEMETPVVDLGSFSKDPKTYAVAMEAIIERELERLNIPGNATDKELQQYVNIIIKQNWIDRNVKRSIQETVDDSNVETFVIIVLSSLTYEFLSDMQR